jgi:ribosomal-protein-alanine N-acetyltransferase
MAWVLPDNHASIRLLERVGFSYEGISRGYLYLHGQWWDHAQYSLLSTDQSPASGQTQ